VARVLILGGGFGGLAAATELRGLLDDADEIVLVARDSAFAMGWTKLWDLTGIRPLAEGTRDLHALGDRGIRYLEADITAIDPVARAATTSQGDLGGDALLVALGAADHPDHVAQLDGEASHNLYSSAALPAAKRALAALDGGRLLVAVMGQPHLCPPAPFEAVLALDEHLRLRGDRDAVDLEIATPAPSALPVAGPEASKTIAAALTDRGITLRTDHTVTRVDNRAVAYDTGEAQEFAVLLAVPANVPPPLVADSPLAGAGGWIHPDRQTLRTAFEGVYAVGDCTTVPTATAALPKAGVFAASEGRVAARNIAAGLGHGAPATFDGHGFCYLEFPGRQVARVEGDFFAEPQPDVQLQPPSTAAYEGKLAFEREQLTAWFGG
jgi:sulfide:quinone oxidoreductase